MSVASSNNIGVVIVCNKWFYNIKIKETDIRDYCYEVNDIPLLWWPSVLRC